MSDFDSDYEEPTFSESDSEHSGDEADSVLGILKKKKSVKKNLNNSSSVVVDQFDSKKYAYRTDLTFPGQNAKQYIGHFVIFWHNSFSKDAVY